jgi:hypothetical protein
MNTARAEAKAAGLKRYNGRQCQKEGHGCVRYVSTDGCIDCVTGYTAKSRGKAPVPTIEAESADAIADADEKFGQEHREAREAEIDRLIQKNPTLASWSRDELSAGIVAGLFKPPPAEAPTVDPDIEFDAERPDPIPDPVAMAAIKESLRTEQDPYAEQIADLTRRYPVLMDITRSELVDMIKAGTAETCAKDYYAS